MTRVLINVTLIFVSGNFIDRLVNLVNEHVSFQKLLIVAMPVQLQRVRGSTYPSGLSLQEVPGICKRSDFPLLKRHRPANCIDGLANWSHSFRVQWQRIAEWLQFQGVQSA